MLLFLKVLVLSCSEEYERPRFYYPEKGNYGLNILNHNITTIKIGKPYSICAKIDNAELKIEIKNEQIKIWELPFFDAYYGWEIDGNYLLTESDSDCKIVFLKSGEKLVRFFENNKMREKIIFVY